MNSAQFLESGDVARVLAVSTQTVRNWVRGGALHFAARTPRIGLFDAGEVERLRRAREQRRQARRSPVK